MTAPASPPQWERVTTPLGPAWRQAVTNILMSDAEYAHLNALLQRDANALMTPGREL